MTRVLSPLLEAVNVHMQVSDALSKLSDSTHLDMDSRRINFADNTTYTPETHSSNMQGRTKSAEELDTTNVRRTRHSPPEKKTLAGNSILKRCDSCPPQGFSGNNEHIPLELDASQLEHGNLQSKSRKHPWRTVQAVSALFHLQKHASTYGLQRHTSTSSDSNDATKKEYGPESPEFLSWKRLHVSRAKLKAVSNSSDLLAGFAMTGLVEVNLNHEVPESILIPFSIVSVILISVHLLALMISICILPKIDAVANTHQPSLVHESPHDELRGYIELAWMCSTVIGLTLFLVEICLVSWVQLYAFSTTSAICVTAILIPIMFLFLAIALHFRQKLAVHTYKVRLHGLQELEGLKYHLDSTEKGCYVNPAFVI